MIQPWSDNKSLSKLRGMGMQHEDKVTGNILTVAKSMDRVPASQIAQRTTKQTFSKCLT